MTVRPAGGAGEDLLGHLSAPSSSPCPLQTDRGMGHTLVALRGKSFKDAPDPLPGSSDQRFALFDETLFDALTVGPAWSLTVALSTLSITPAWGPML